MTRFAEMRKRLWFLLGALVVYRIGTFIPVPGIDAARFAAFFSNQQGTLLGMFHVLRWRAAAIQHLRAERHAVHHRLHHHPDGVHGVSAVGADPQGRRVGVGAS